MTFAGSAADHQRAHHQEARKQFSDEGHGAREGGDALEHVLIHHEEGLNRQRLAAIVGDEEVFVVEPVLHGIFEDLVVTMILA